jgi:hypothetical protein
MTNYATKEEWAIRQDYATWAAYTADNPSAPSEDHLEDMLETATQIINDEIGSFSLNVTDSRFTTRLKKLCLKMVDRMRQVDMAQGKFNTIPFFSPNDYLIEREREYLRQIGRILSHRRVGKVAF